MLTTVFSSARLLTGGSSVWVIILSIICSIIASVFYESIIKKVLKNRFIICNMKYLKETVEIVIITFLLIASNISYLLSDSKVVEFSEEFNSNFRVMILVGLQVLYCLTILIVDCWAVYGIFNKVHPVVKMNVGFTRFVFVVLNAIICYALKAFYFTNPDLFTDITCLYQVIIFLIGFTDGYRYWSKAIALNVPALGRVKIESSNGIQELNKKLSFIYGDFYLYRTDRIECVELEKLHYFKVKNADLSFCVSPNVFLDLD